MKRKDLMKIVALAAGLSSGLAGGTTAQAKPPSATIEHGNGHGNGNVHPGHFIGHGHFHHGNGHGWGHHHHDHDIY